MELNVVSAASPGAIGAPVSGEPGVRPELADRVTPQSPPQEIVRWALHRFAGQRIVLTTQFGMEGCALIDLCAQVGMPLRVVYLDTMFFFPETYALRDRLAARYPHLSFENGGTDLTPEEQADRHGPQLWKRDPDLCCRLRKVEPMRRVMRDVDLWLTALRRDQSPARANLQVVEWDWRFMVLQVNPFSYWTRADVWNHVRTREVPYNPLHEQGYPTIGCTHCTRPVPGATVTTYSRDGRWHGRAKTECGLHGDGI